MKALECLMATALQKTLCCSLLTDMVPLKELINPRTIARHKPQPCLLVSFVILKNGSNVFSEDSLSIGFPEFLIEKKTVSLCSVKLMIIGRLNSP